MGEQKEINVTYESLFELMRREKMREELQELIPTFFDDVLDYLVEKQKIFDETKHKTDIFSSQEREKTISQIKNVHKILRELYDRREFKIIMMATNKSRTGSSIINTTNMLKEEVLLFERLVSELSIFRTGIMENLLALRKPSLIDYELQQPEPAPDRTPVQEPAPEKPAIKKVKLLEDVPKFIGPELETYGPYNKEQVIDMPPEIAKLLINKGSAVEV